MCCLIRICEEFAILFLLLSKEGANVLAGFLLGLGFLGAEHGNGTRGSHHGNLAGGPCEVQVGTQLLASHHDVATAIRLAECNRNLGNGGLAVSVEQLGSMQDDGIVLLTRSGQESWNVDKAHNGNVERIAEAHEAGTLARGVGVEHTGIGGGLVGHDAYALSVEACKADDDVLRKLGLHLEEFSVVGDSCYHLIHIIGLVGVVGDDFVEQVFLAVDGVGALHTWSLLHVVRRNVGKQRLDHRHCLLFGLGRERRHTTLRGVNAGSTEILGINILARYSLHNGRTGQEHIRCVLHHQDEVGEGRGVDGTTCARTHDGRDLRNHTRGKDVALEDFTIAGQRADTFLNAGAARVVHANHRCTVLHSHIHDLANLLRHRLRERAAVHREVLRADIHQAAIDGGRAYYNAVAGELLLLHSEVVAAMQLEHVVLLEGTLVDEHLNALTGGVFATLVLLVDRFLSSAQTGFLPTGNEVLDFFCLFTHFIVNFY